MHVLRAANCAREGSRAARRTRPRRWRNRSGVRAIMSHARHRVRRFERPGEPREPSCTGPAPLSRLRGVEHAARGHLSRTNQEEPDMTEPPNYTRIDRDLVRTMQPAGRAY